MSYAIEIRPITPEEILQERPKIDAEVRDMALSAKIADSPEKLIIRDLMPRDLYDPFHGKTDVTLALANNYQWKWTWSGATAGSEVTLIEVPANVLQDWSRAVKIFYLALYDPNPKVSELRFYKENVVAVSVPMDCFDRYGTLLVTFRPRIGYTKTDTSLKITAIVEEADGELWLELGGRAGLPTGIAGEPNPKVIEKGRV